MKICGKCNLKKEKKDFGRNTKTPDGLKCYCYECSKKIARIWLENNRGRVNSERRRKYNDIPEHRARIKEKSLEYRKKHREGACDKVRERTYGITPKEYNDICQSQNMVCAICGSPSRRRLCVDHNHNTGEIRGLLCDNCNRAIGLLKEDISILEKACSYLARYN